MGRIAERPATGYYAAGSRCAPILTASCGCAADGV